MKSREYYIELSGLVSGALFALSSAYVSAESLTNENGVVYENVTVISATPKDLLITYSCKGRTSAISLPLKSLPLDVQQRYGYAQSKEDAYKAEMARKEAAKAELLERARRHAPVVTNTFPRVSGSSPTAAQANIRASPVPTVDGGLSESEIKDLNAQWSDTNAGINYLFTASMSRAKVSANDQKRYVESGKVPFTISVQFSQQIAGQKTPKQILEGRAHFYVYDSDGNVVVQPLTETLLQLCKH